MEFENQLYELFQRIEHQYQELSSEGKHRENIASGDVVTEIDQAVTELVIDYFENLEPGFAIQSEELNKTTGNREGTGSYTVILDEIDGTRNMKDETGPFGPIVAIAEGTDPRFGDVVAAGFLNIPENSFYEAYRDEGAYMSNGLDGERKRISANDKKDVEDLAVLVDQSMLGKAPEIAEQAWKHYCTDYSSMGQNLALIADGTRDVFITGGFSYLKDKNTAEEIAALHLIISEADGTVVDWDNNDIEDTKIGLNQQKNHNIIAASTPELARKISEQFIPDRLNQ